MTDFTFLSKFFCCFWVDFVWFLTPTKIFQMTKNFFKIFRSFHLSFLSHFQIILGLGESSVILSHFQIIFLILGFWMSFQFFFHELFLFIRVTLFLCLSIANKNNVVSAMKIMQAFMQVWNIFYGKSVSSVPKQYKIVCTKVILYYIFLKYFYTQNSK